MTRPVFIVGFPRSGTTLLRSRIAQHPDIHLVNEPEIIFGLLRAGRDTKSKFPISEELLSQLKEIGLCKYHLDRLDAHYLKGLLDDGGLYSFADAYEALLPKPPGLKVWGEKSLNNCFFLKEISEIYPNALIVNITRNVKSCVLSKYKKELLSKSKKNNINHKIDFTIKNIVFFAKYSLYWSLWTKITDYSIINNCNIKNILNIKYEEFVKDPEKYLKVICEKLSIFYDPAMLDYDHNRVDQVLLTGSAYAHENISKHIDASKISTFKEIPDSLTFVVERFAGRQMAENGYAVEKRRLPLPIRIVMDVILFLNGKHIYKFVKRKLNKRSVDPLLVREMLRN